MKTFTRGAVLGSLCLGLALSTSSFTAQAAIIGTEQMVSVSQRVDDLRTVQDFMARDLVAGELEKFGADAVQARERVAALSDAELRQLADQIRSAPAGAGVIEIIGIVFIVLFILELVGVINVFSSF